MAKKFLFNLITLLSITLLWSCGSSSSDEPAVDTSLKITSVSPSGVIPAEGGEITINVTGSDPKAKSSDPSWLRLAKREVVGTSGVFAFNVEPNKAEERKATITFTSGSQSVTLDITQEKYSEPVIPDPDPTPMPMLGLGWNLGNHFDGHINEVATETGWGNPAATQALFDKLAADGITSVRIPVTYLGKVGAAPDYKIDEAWLSRVKEVIGYAEKAGLKVVTNIHHDGADSKYWLNIKKAAADDAINKQIKEQLAAMWTQIATALKDKGDFLIFEPFNEIHDGGWGWGDNLKDGGKQYRCVNEWNQVFVDAVRATGGNNATRYLAAVGYCTNPSLTMENLVLPNDPANHLIVSVHFYDPSEFTLTCKYDEWGHTGADGKKDKYSDEASVRDIFGKLKTKYIDKGIPVYIGEGGCSRHASARGELFREYYLEYVARAARVYGMSYIIWDNGATGSGAECHGYYRHDNGEYIGNAATMIKALKKGFFTNSPDYTLQSIYNNAPK